MIAALIPGAGRSVRMGAPKLLLPLGGQSVISRLVTAFRLGGAVRVVVVTPPRDSELAELVRAEVEHAGGTAVIPATQPTDMRASIMEGLNWLEQGPPNAFFLCPADVPGIDAAIVAGLIVDWQSDPTQPIVATRGGRRAHPLLLPWTWAASIRSLPDGQGVNTLIANLGEGPRTREFPEHNVHDDLDTPEDYQRWAARFERQAGLPIL